MLIFNSGTITVRDSKNKELGYLYMTNLVAEIMQRRILTDINQKRLILWYHSIGIADVRRQ
jgi:hypothetical protein